MHMRHTIFYFNCGVRSKGYTRVTFRAGRLINCTACETPWESIEGHFLLFYVDFPGEHCELRVFKEKQRLSAIIVIFLQFFHRMLSSLY